MPASREDPMRFRFPLLALAGLSLLGLTCAPDVPSSSKKKNEETSQTPADDANDKRSLSERLDAALDNVRRRELSTDHAFWTVFHGILGMGPGLKLRIPGTDEFVNAVEQVTSGKGIRGLEFLETLH